MSANRDGAHAGFAAAEATSTGEWITPAVSYVDPARRFCEFCGRPIARKFWHVETTSGPRVFCDPAHAALHTTYPKSYNLTVGDS